jgi:hypothetical protein
MDAIKQVSLSHRFDYLPLNARFSTGLQPATCLTHARIADTFSSSA